MKIEDSFYLELQKKTDELLKHLEPFGFKKRHENDLVMERFCSKCKGKVDEIHITPTIPLTSKEGTDYLVKKFNQQAKEKILCSNCQAKKKL